MAGLFTILLPLFLLLDNTRPLGTKAGDSFEALSFNSDEEDAVYTQLSINKSLSLILSLFLLLLSLELPCSTELVSLFTQLFRLVVAWGEREEEASIVLVVVVDELLTEQLLLLLLLLYEARVVHVVVPVEVMDARLF